MISTLDFIDSAGSHLWREVGVRPVQKSSIKSRVCSRD
jgi:hypothetical protein